MKTIDKSRATHKELNVTSSNKNLVLDIFNELPIGVIIVSSSTNYWLNNATINIFGFKKEEPVYKKIKEELLPLVLDKTGLEYPFSNEEDYKDFEISLKNKEQQTICLNISPKHIHFNNQQSLLLLVNDISAQKISKKDYRELMENMQAGVVVHDAETSIITSNKTASKILGLSIDQMKGKKAIDPEWQFVRDDGTLMPLEEFPVNIVRSTNKSLQNYVVGIKRPDRNYITWAFCNAFPDHDESNNLLKITVTFIEITEIKKTELDLQLKDNVFEASIASNSIANPNGIITYVNNAFLELWGYENKDDAIGNSVADFFVNQEDAASVLEALNTVGKWEGEFLACKRNGDRFISKGLATVIKDKNGNLIGYQSANLDVSAQKKAEEEIQNLNASLEQRVKDRTKSLEEANKELESFSYSVSHDLRAPLRAIIGYSNILLEDYTNKLDQEGINTIHVITKSTQRMSHLIDDILSFSRLSRKEIRKQHLNMKEKFISTFEEVIKGYSIQNINFKVNDLYNIEGDDTMIQLAISNLISNAIKYSSKNNNSEIEISSHADLNQTVFKVSDNGIGFDEKYADKIFGVFQRLHTNNEFEGTGVGLAIVKRIITKHGGNVWAHSEINKGTSFYFSIPTE